MIINFNISSLKAFHAGKTAWVVDSYKGVEYVFCHGCPAPWQLPTNLVDYLLSSERPVVLLTCYANRLRTTLPEYVTHWCSGAPDGDFPLVVLYPDVGGEVEILRLSDIQQIVANHDLVECLVETTAAQKAATRIQEYVELLEIFYA